MSFKFFNYTMSLDEFIRLNWDDLPYEIRQCQQVSDGIIRELEQEIEYRDDRIGELESDVDFWKDEHDTEKTRADELEHQIDLVKAFIKDTKKSFDRKLEELS